jgi:hypothetical protein
MSAPTSCRRALLTCRALLHQIAEYAPAVLARMAAAVKPGGWLLVQVDSLGLGRPQAKTDVQNIRGRDRGALYFRLFLAEVRDRVLDSGRLDAATLDAASALLDDPSYWTQCWMMTAVWARKPRPGPEHE